MKYQSVFVALISSLIATPALAASYDVTDIGALFPSGTIGDYNYDVYSYGNSINNNGQLTGVECNTGFNNCNHFLYSNGVITILGSSLFNLNHSAINNNGDVVYTIGLGPSYVYSNGVATEVDTKSVGSFNIATDINDKGQISGIFGSDREHFHAYLYENGAATDLGTLNSGTAWGGDGGTLRSTANAINNSGQVIGWSNNQNEFSSSGFLYSNGIMSPIPVTGNDINDNGQITGGVAEAFIYSNGQITNIGSGTGESINNNGWVVGNDGSNGPFIYNNGRLNLNSLIDPNSGWVLTEANGINDSGSIVGTGFINGQQHAFLAILVNSLPDGSQITSVPEPEVYLMYLTGLGIFGFSIRSCNLPKRLLS